MLEKVGKRFKYFSLAIVYLSVYACKKKEQKLHRDCVNIDSTTSTVTSIKQII